MPWLTIAAGEVISRLTPVELATLEGIAGLADQMPGILTNVVNATRGNLRGGGNQLDVAGTIPDQVREEVIALALWKFLISFPVLKSMQTPARQAASKQAQDLFSLMASQKQDRPRTELPANVDATNVPLIQPSIGPGKLRHFRRRNEDGIV